MLLHENLLNSHQVETDSSPTGASLSVKMASVPGGYSDPKPATDEIKKICHEVQNQVEGKTNQKYHDFKPVTYRCQVVAGKNFLVKIHAGADHYIHVKLFQGLPCNGGKIAVNGVQEHHKKDDPLVPF
ncbi:cystatin-A-like [Betta splendens]|uniref:Cystatin-B n=1 Tax=Betta splendens TaxID=158456 RepID=A0A6P7M986_BETSP|nr:cystatin-A-like [Betta splendens]XP_029002743.1 cystatin-A-like [Betta splendens]